MKSIVNILMAGIIFLGFQVMNVFEVYDMYCLALWTCSSCFMWAVAITLADVSVKIDFACKAIVSGARWFATTEERK
jgi:hypothetical protein